MIKKIKKIITKILDHYHLAVLILGADLLLRSDSDEEMMAGVFLSIMSMVMSLMESALRTSRSSHDLAMKSLEREQDTILQSMNIEVYKQSNKSLMGEVKALRKKLNKERSTD